MLYNSIDDQRQGSDVLQLPSPPSSFSAISKDPGCLQRRADVTRKRKLSRSVSEPADCEYFSKVDRGTEPTGEADRKRIRLRSSSQDKCGGHPHPIRVIPSDNTCDDAIHYWTQTGNWPENSLKIQSLGSSVHVLGRDASLESADCKAGSSLQWPQTANEFATHLCGQTDEIECIVSQYLQSDQACEVSDQSEWRFGSYNVCIPVAVTGASAYRLAFKCPLPHRFRGRYDLMDEKIRCEAGASTWISQNCTRVPIPKLRGFGLSIGLNFISAAHLSWYRRVGLALENLWAWLLRRPTCRQFVACQRPASLLKSGYVLMDYVEEGAILSSVLPPRTPEETVNLFKSVAGITLDLAQPLCKIGSFTVDDRGHVSLSNRPLTMMLANLEIDGIPTNISQQRCYLEADSYFSDLLYCHDLRLVHLPDSVRDIGDGEGQMAVLTMMRSLIAPMTQRDLKSGPFALRMTDLNTSNFMVDDQFNVTALVDLEWFCSLPMETISPPFWLSGHYVDDLLEDEEHPQVMEKIRANIEDFEKMCEEFSVIYEQEDLSRRSLLASGFRTRVMKTAIERRTHWLWLALNNPQILYNIFIEHIQPVFAPSHLFNPAATHFQKTLAPYWSIDALQMLRGKIFDDETRSSRLSRSNL